MTRNADFLVTLGFYPMDDFGKALYDTHSPTCQVNVSSQMIMSLKGYRSVKR